MAGHLKLELLGGCRLTLDGAALDLHFAKSRALLCYLAVTGTAHSREVLADLLWGEGAEDAARLNLRVRLSGLRQALPGHLTVTRGAVAFNRGSDHDLDVEALLAALQRPDDLAGQRAAVRLYRGDLLEGFHVSKAPAFETWLAGQRERLRGLVLEALHRLAEHHAAREEYDQARDDWTHFLALDPWREDAHRQLMRVLAMNGQRGAAVAQYLTCCRVLAGELGLEPSSETTRLYEQIRAGALGPATTPARSSPVLAERRQLTALHCELTDLGTLNDPEEWHERLGAYHHLCTEAAARSGGVVAQRQGPSVLALFGYPLAQEDDARRAVQAGLDLLARLRASPLALGARIGIHTGTVVVTPREGGAPEVVGLTPVAAGRLQAHAEVGELLISGATARLVQGFFVTQARGSRLLDGLAEPLEVYQVRGETAARSRLQAVPPRTALVGRAGELSQLRRCWNEARAGRGQAVLVTGEAGIGKSRLLYALREELRSVPVRWLEAQSSAALIHSPFAPVVALLEQELGSATNDTPEDRLGKLEAALSRSGLFTAEALPLVASLLGLPDPPHSAPPPTGPEQQRQATLDLLVRWLEREAAREPVVFVLEDLHWCDPSTLDLLDRLVGRVRGTRLLILLTARPEGGARWVPAPQAEQVRLAPLGPRDTAALIEQLLGETRLPHEVRQALQVRSDGIPLYIEELAREVLEAGGGATHLAGSLTIPSTLHDALTSRLDRLGEARGVAQLASVIGRTFSLDLLAATSTPGAAVQQALVQLMDAGLIAPGAAGGQYVFRHALIQDAAYASLLKRTRQGLHARVAGVLAEQFGEIVQRQPELLAGHYAAAGLVDRALPLWRQAAGRALARSAHHEAAGLFRTALGALSTLPQTPERDEQELGLLLGLGAALHSARSYADPEVEEVYRRAHTLSRTVGPSPHLFTALLGLAGHAFMRGQYEVAWERVEQMLGLSPSQLGELHVGQLHCMATRVTGVRGQFRTSLAHAERVLGLPEPAVASSAAATGIPPQDAKVVSLSASSVILWLIGYPDQARARAASALRYANDTQYLYMQASALLYNTLIQYLRREPRGMLEHLEAFTRLTTEQGPTHWLAQGQIWRGTAQVEAGRPEGLTLAREGLAHLDAAGLVTYRPLFLSLIAGMQGQAGDLEAALQILHDAVVQVEATGEHWWEAELYRLRGDLLLRLGRPEEAERSLLQAVDVARGQEARSLELRAATSLARLWRDQGQEAEAGALLKGIYGGFTEGFDTPDLQEAGRLLESIPVSRPA